MITFPLFSIQRSRDNNLTTQNFESGAQCATLSNSSRQFESIRYNRRIKTRTSELATWSDTIHDTRTHDNIPRRLDATIHDMTRQQYPWEEFSPPRHPGAGQLRGNDTLTALAQPRTLVTSLLQETITTHEVLALFRAYRNT